MPAGTSFLYGQEPHGTLGGFKVMGTSLFITAPGLAGLSSDVVENRYLLAQRACARLQLGCGRLQCIDGYLGVFIVMIGYRLHHDLGAVGGGFMSRTDVRKQQFDCGHV